MAPSLLSAEDDDVFEPNLPGWRPRPAKPATFFKPQTLTYANGGSTVESLPSQREREGRAQEKAEEARRARRAAEAGAAAAVSSSPSASAAASKPGSSSSSSSSSFPAPRYVANAGVVLRYRGWFTEPVPAGSSRLEAKKAGVGVGVGGGGGGGGAAGAAAPSSFASASSSSSSSSSAAAAAAANGVRVRQVELRLYLEDNTADVVERRTLNSGLEQGLIARRHALSRRAAVAAKGGGPTAAAAAWGGRRKRDDGGDNDADPFAPRAKTAGDAPLGPEDIRVGDVIDVFGRSITIADADAATWAWLRSAAEAAADAAAGAGGADSDEKKPPSPFAGLPGEAIPVPEGDYEVAMRAASEARELGKARRCAEVSGNNSAGARLWDRLPVPAGGWKPAPKSLGEDDPKSIMAWLSSSDGGGGGKNGKAASSQPKTRPPLPPHNGFGSEEDSANSCLRLSPRARVRRAPSAADEGVEASFAARMAGPELVPGACRLGEGDAGRRFSVRWTPADGAVSVFEEKAPGFPGGKFLERNPVRRPACACAKSGGVGVGVGVGVGGFSSAAPGISACGACGGSRGGETGGGGGGGAANSSSSSSASLSPSSSSYYSEPDFYVGAPLRLHGRGFVLLAAEEPALRRMEAAGHPLARREEAAAAARAALESAAEEAASSAGSSAVAFGGSELLREALAAVALQKREREEEEKKKGTEDVSRRRGGAAAAAAARETSSSPSPPLLLLTPEELGEAFAAAGAPLRGPAQVQVTLARALGGSERPGNRVDPAEVVERLFG